MTQINNQLTITADRWPLTGCYLSSKLHNVKKRYTCVTYILCQMIWSLTAQVKHLLRSGTRYLLSIRKKWRKIRKQDRKELWLCYTKATSAIGLHYSLQFPWQHCAIFAYLYVSINSPQCWRQVSSLNVTSSLLKTRHWSYTTTLMDLRRYYLNCGAT